MKITQIRNATLQINYAGKTFLIDPMLAQKEAYPGFSGTVNSEMRYPTVDLPINITDILQVDAIIVTHTHPDHWDQAAIDLIAKDKLIFVQNESDAQLISRQGFSQVHILSENTHYQGITFSKTGGQHGNDHIMALLGQRMGQVCGIVFKHPNEKTLYIAGDTIWNQEVKDAISIHQPDIIILNCGDAQVIELGSIIMNKQDIQQVYQTALKATIIASHMEAVNHATLTRTELRQFIQQHNMIDRVLIPIDGESYCF